MGLLDILNGMQNGPRGERHPGAGTGGGGMSPMMMALLGLLAYKAVKSVGASSMAGQGAQTPGGEPGGAGGLGGILGRLFGGGPSREAGPAGTGPATSASDMSPGGLGNLFSGAAAGTVVSSGLGTLVRDLHESGHGQAAQSWVGSGPNQEIAPSDLEHALGADTLDTLSQKTGMNRDDLLSTLCQHLPELINRLTPDGRLPTDKEAARLG